MKVLEFQKFWTTCDTRNYFDYLFIFGDNDIHKGKKGQATIRDEPNAIGIPTKKYPSLDEGAYYTDDEYEKNKEKIDKAINNVISILKNGKYKGIILSKDGLGTGLSKLDIKAPKTMKYLNISINKLMDIVLKTE